MIINTIATIISNNAMIINNIATIISNNAMIINVIGPIINTIDTITKSSTRSHHFHQVYHEASPDLGQKPESASSAQNLPAHINPHHR